MQRHVEGVLPVARSPPPSSKGPRGGRTSSRHSLACTPRCLALLVPLLLLGGALSLSLTSFIGAHHGPTIHVIHLEHGGPAAPLQHAARPGLPGGVPAGAAADIALADTVPLGSSSSSSSGGGSSSSSGGSSSSGSSLSSSGSSSSSSSSSSSGGGTPSAPIPTTPSAPATAGSADASASAPAGGASQGAMAPDIPLPAAPTTSGSADGRAASTPAAGSGAGAGAGLSAVWPWLPAEVLQKGASLAAAFSKARAKEVLKPSQYLIPPEPLDMRAQHRHVKKYLSSAAFKEAVAERRKGPPRGIIISGGGRKYLSAAIVLLKVLREVHGCQLPVELVWHTSVEMDAASLAAVQRRFGPVRGYNLSDMPWPAHQRQHRNEAALEGVKSFLRFEKKVRTLLHSRFQSVLLLDADNLPLVPPDSLWDDPEVKAHGALFWPDYWSRTADDTRLYDMVGLGYPLGKDAISAGKGSLQRDTESGAFVMDLVRHADVVEWLVWINSFGESIYRTVWGDKDTYAMAFAVAGKAHDFTQVQVPPGAALTWRKDMLLDKKWRTVGPGWQLGGMVQFNNTGAPVLVHRTFNKLAYGDEPWELERLTAPAPRRWVRYYLDQTNLGMTVGVPWDYVVPDASLATWGVNPAMKVARPRGAKWEVTPEDPGCPALTWLDYVRAREHGLPVGELADDGALRSACRALLPALMGPSGAAAYRAAGFDRAPELAAAAAGDWDPVAWDDDDEVGDPTPLAAWHPHYFRPHMETHVTRALRASHQALDWLKRNVKEFPTVEHGP